MHLEWVNAPKGLIRHAEKMQLWQTASYFYHWISDLQFISEIKLYIITKMYPNELLGDTDI